LENSRFRNRNDNEVQLHKNMYTVWGVLRPVMVFITSLLIVVGFVYYGIDYVLQNYWLPADKNDATPIQIEIPKGSSVSEIAEILEGNNLIRNADVFEYYIDFSGYRSKVKFGSYIFNKQMTMQDIANRLSKGTDAATVTTFTVIEGLNIEQAAEKLLQDGIIPNKDHFLELCRTGTEFLNYSFIAELDYEQEADRKYMMEGYLFPDKYEIYVGSSEETIIKKMLNKFGDVLNERLVARADELGMTIDDVITLASIIEKEAKPNDFAKVSAVFHNRIKQRMKLESCATAHYYLGYKKLKLSSEEISVNSPYNTYLYPGLPAGPICSPSAKAIEAALYPDEQFVIEGYLFFCTKDPQSGELVFNITASEHQKAVEQYEPLWREYDQQNSGN